MDVDQGTLGELREWCLTRFRRRTGQAVDLSLTMQGTVYVLETIVEHRASRILELGAGFSTLAIRMHVGPTRAVPGWHRGTWKGKTENILVMTADHDPSWLAFVGQLLEQRKLRSDGLGTMDALRKEPLPDVDLVLVDHGPEMKTRLDDLPWIADHMSHDGVILLDDFRKTTGYQRQATGLLASLGWKVEVDERSRSSSNRAVGIARRVGDERRNSA